MISEFAGSPMSASDRSPEKEQHFTILVCPGCGEQITNPPERDPQTYEYKRGHYHEPPEGWWTEDGPGPENFDGEDPWFDALEVEVIPADHPALLSKHEARTVLAAAFGEDHDEYAFDAAIQRLSNYAGEQEEGSDGG